MRNSCDIEGSILAVLDGVEVRSLENDLVQTSFAKARSTTTGWSKTTLS